MRLANEANLVLLILVPLLALLAWYGLARRRAAIERLGNMETLRRMIDSVSGARRAARIGLRLLAVTLLVVALARPQWGQKENEIIRRGRDIFIAVDTSLSMLAEDIPPNRIREAKRRIKQLTQILQGDRVGLIAFAGTAFVQCPLTLDYGGFQLALEGVDVGVIPQEGTNINAAIETALASFVQTERKYKVLILITDGESWEGDPQAIAAKAAEQGVKIYAVGIGNRTGVPIPEIDENGNRVGYFKMPNSDQPVLTKLDETTLQKVALATNGVYYRASSEGIEIEKIYEDIMTMEAKELEGKKLVLHEDRFAWFLVPALLLLIGEILLPERRRNRNRTASLARSGQAVS